MLLCSFYGRMNLYYIIFRVDKSRGYFKKKKKKKKMPAASYSRTGESRTTLGDGALNFSVRNGNWCDNPSMATGKKP